MAKKKNTLDALWSKIKRDKERKFKALKTQHKKLTEEIALQKRQIMMLKKTGVIFGTESWKSQVTKHDGSRKQYLRILCPNGTRKYIGCDEEKVKHALASLKRGRRYKRLEMGIQRAEHKLQKIVGNIKEI
jgi:hypothetical protein